MLGEVVVDVVCFCMVLIVLWQIIDFLLVCLIVEDECEYVGFYLVQVLYWVILVLYELLQQVLFDIYGEDLLLFCLLCFGIWVGGDMDGNLNVDVGIICVMFDVQCQVVLGCYQKDLLQLVSLFSQFIEWVVVSDVLQVWVVYYWELLLQVILCLCYVDMFYCLFNDCMCVCVQVIFDDVIGVYVLLQVLEDDFMLILDSLYVNKGDYVGGFVVCCLLWCVCIFGFYLVCLDVCQELSVYGCVLVSVLDGQEVWDVVDVVVCVVWLVLFVSGEQVLLVSIDDGGVCLDVVFVVLVDVCYWYGIDVLGSYIILMVYDCSDVLVVLVLVWCGGLVDDVGVVLFDIVLLFEMVDDFKCGIDILWDLLVDLVYCVYLIVCGDVQMVMLGYFDSGKDGGIVVLCWGLQCVQVELLEVVVDSGIWLIFFYGCGGLISCGGGKIIYVVDVLLCGSIDGCLCVIEQGEVIYCKYGICVLVLCLLEQFIGVVLWFSLCLCVLELCEVQWWLVMDLVVVRSVEVYCVFVGQKNFMQYFCQVMLIDVIEWMMLGLCLLWWLGEDVVLFNLCVILWVFVWSQVWVVILGWYGVGSGLQVVIDVGYEVMLQEMVCDWLFFSIFLDDIVMVLFKGDIIIVEQFLWLFGLLYGVFFLQIQCELVLIGLLILVLIGQDELLQYDQCLVLLICLCNFYVDFISVLQVDLLCCWCDSGGDDDDVLCVLVVCVNGVLQGVQNIGQVKVVLEVMNGWVGWMLVVLDGVVLFFCVVGGGLVWLYGDGVCCWFLVVVVVLGLVCFCCLLLLL